jgi:hypothetical protein
VSASGGAVAALCRAVSRRRAAGRGPPPRRAGCRSRS